VEVRVILLRNGFAFSKMLGSTTSTSFGKGCGTIGVRGVSGSQHLVMVPHGIITRCYFSISGCSRRPIPFRSLPRLVLMTSNLRRPSSFPKLVLDSASKLLFVLLPTKSFRAMHLTFDEQRGFTSRATECCFGISSHVMSSMSPTRLRTGGAHSRACSLRRSEVPTAKLS
jgi:hypothetical protein